MKIRHASSLWLLGQRSPLRSWRSRFTRVRILTAVLETTFSHKRFI
ncbi:hypothetical protein [Azospirillum endophyticum]